MYHIWNRAVGRLRLFKKEQDYHAFERILLEAHRHHPLRILDWCLMPNHWHFVVWPETDQQVTDFFKWVAHTQAMRAISHRRAIGMGPLYQGRFKSLPVQTDDHLETLLRYVLRNPVRAKLARDAGSWKHSGLWMRRNGEKPMREMLSRWPIDMPRNWNAWLGVPQPPAELERLREHVRRNRPFGSDRWTQSTAARLGLQSTLHPRGRPRVAEGK